MTLIKHEWRVSKRERKIHLWSTWSDQIKKVFGEIAVWQSHWQGSDWNLIICSDVTLLPSLNNCALPIYEATSVEQNIRLWRWRRVKTTSRTIHNKKVGTVCDRSVQWKSKRWDINHWAPGAEDGRCRPLSGTRRAHPKVQEVTNHRTFTSMEIKFL